MNRKLTAKEKILGLKIIFYVAMSFFPNKRVRRSSASKVIDLINILESGDNHEV